MGKHITYEWSEVICRIHQRYQGKWNDIMADPEIKALGLERHSLQHHVSYKRRRHPNSNTESFGSSSSSEEEEEEEEFELVRIAGRKKGTGNIPTKWYAIYSDGDERWVPENCFVDLDGTANALFINFQSDHPNNDDVKIIVNAKKRSLMDELEHRETKKQKTIVIEEEEKPIQQRKILLKIPPPVIPPDKKTVCLQMVQELLVETEKEKIGLEREVSLLRQEISIVRQGLEEVLALIRPLVVPNGHGPLSYSRINK